MSASAEAKATTDAANHVVRIAKCLRDNKFTELEIEKKPGVSSVHLRIANGRGSVHSIRVEKGDGKELFSALSEECASALDNVLKCAEEYLDDIRSCEGYHRVMIGASKE